MIPLPPAEIAKYARQATALLVHFGEENLEGINAVLSECKTGEDTVLLFIALLGLIEHLAPNAYTPAGMAIIRGTLADLARQECS